MDIIGSIIKLNIVFQKKINQVILIMMKVLILIKNVMKLVQLVQLVEHLNLIIVINVVLIQMENIFITLFHQIQKIVYQMVTINNT